MYGAKPAAARGAPQTAAAAPTSSTVSSSSSSLGRWEHVGSGSSDRNRGFDRERDREQTAGRSQRSNGAVGGGGGYRERDSREGAGAGAGSHDRRGGQRTNGGHSASSGSASAAAAALPAAFSSMHLAAPSVPATRPSPLLSHVSPAARGRYAYVFLVMKGDSYAVGAITCAYSLKLTGTRHSLVCMVTPDVSAACRSTMLSVFNEVLEVPYLEYRVKPLRTHKQRNMYNSWVESAFTKWNMLSLVAFEKTIFVDADKIVLRNIDHLFDECAAPAGTFSSPWSQPFVERKDAFARANGGPTRSRSKGKSKQGMPNPYADCVHTSRVTSTMVQSALRSQSFVVIGTMVLLSPCLEDYAQYKLMLEQMQPFGFEECHSMMDEQSLSYYFAVRKNELIQRGEYGKATERSSASAAAAAVDAAVPASSSVVAASSAAPTSSLPSSAVSEWSYIHQQYNFVPWHRYWLSSSPAPAIAAAPAASAAAASVAVSAASSSSPSPSALSSTAAAELEVEVPYVFHFFNTKPWAQDRAAYLDLESWWEVAIVMLSASASELTEQQREKLRALYDPKQLQGEKIRGCCWCRATLEQEGKSNDESWKGHNIFDAQGRTECPDLIKGFERDEARRRGNASEAPACAAASASSATVAASS